LIAMQATVWEEKIEDHYLCFLEIKINDLIQIKNPFNKKRFGIL